MTKKAYKKRLKCKNYMNYKYFKQAKSLVISKKV